jgi:hypothetical protein
MNYYLINKKYQPIRLFLSDTETLILNEKETRKIFLTEISQYMRDMEAEGVIQLKQIKEGK